MKIRLLVNEGGRWVTLTAWEKGGNYFLRIYLAGRVILVHVKISAPGGLTKQPPA